MGITSTRMMTGAAGLVVAAALGIGVAAGQSGTVPELRPARPDLHRGDQLPIPARPPSPGCGA